MRFLKLIFTWWAGSTVGTSLMTRFYGKKVGEDALGNAYYENEKTGKRWVIYHDYSEASQVPADWHGWLHHTFDNRPGQEPLPHYEWELPHQENLTGTVNAYAPSGSQYAQGAAPKSYQAWIPNEEPNA